MHACLILPLFITVVAEEYEYLLGTDDPHLYNDAPLDSSSEDVSHSLAPCPTNYLDGDDGKCYKVYTNHSNYVDASHQCQRDGGKLVSVTSAKKNDMIAKMAKDAGVIVWLGMKCIKPHVEYCAWDDSSRAPYAYTSFFRGNPNSIGECVLMMIGEIANGKWVSADCDYMRIGFVCQVTRKKYCGDYDEYKKGGTCYKAFNLHLSQEEAEQYCQQDCGHLASVHNFEENQLLYEMAKNNMSYARLGLRTVNNELSWGDNSTFDYNNFGVNNTALGDCVAMSLKNEVIRATQWINVPCDQGLPFICQRARGACYNTTSTLPSSTMAPTTCDEPQYFSQNGTIYSPGFPGLYYGFKSCYYIMTVPSDRNVRIHFPYLNLHPDSCIKLYNSVIDSLPSDSVSFLTPPTKYFQSSTNVMKMVFVPPPNAQEQWYNVDYSSAWKAEFS
ncbi:unnamed protein product [Cylicocyclus nassatus]|uniref:Uncharacterized protein n=1 Tax=Cylicocyclus nassatus TaxID=53992 RepID=A0AA36DSM8_CYLNA|nr:unnamed protein product [Cylicocyclus nassatus]